MLPMQQILSQLPIIKNRPRAHPSSCSGCPLDKLGVGFAEPEGKCTLGVLIVGEALGEAESKDSLPFRPYAQAGSVLDRIIRKATFSREQFGFFNLVNCRPPDNALDGAPWELGAVNHCSPNLRRVVEHFRPKVILALGGVPLRHLTGMAGRKRGISLLRGFALQAIQYRGDDGRPLTVISSYHPSFIARGASKLIGVLIRDIQFAVQVAREGIERETPHYIEFPTAKDASEFIHELEQDISAPVAYDIETDYSTREADESELQGRGAITQIQFSLRPGSAIVCPWQGRWIEFSKKVLASPNPKWGWNSAGFDDRILKANGIQISGPRHDLMRAWGHSQPDLPKGLQYATSFYAPTLPPWKHLADSQAEFYGGLDVDSVQRIGRKIFTDLSAAGIRSGYDRHVAGLIPVLERMCARGLPVDPKRREAFRAEVELARKAAGESIQELVPEELKQKHPAQGYKVNPKPIRLWLAEAGIKFKPKEDRHYSPELIEAAKAEGYRWGSFEGQERFYQELPFLATSTQQVLAYIRAKGHRVPLGLKSRKETTEKKELLRLAQRTGDNFYLKVVEYRELLKVVSTYIDGWDLDSEGRVHSTILPGPATGQLASRDPNIQNIPKAGKLAKAFRNIIVPKTGHALVAFDFVGFHSLMTGYLAKDPGFMLLSRLGIHDYLSGHLLRLPKVDEWLGWSIEDLAAILAETKEKHPDTRRKAKSALHGYNFGMKAQRLYDENIENFKSKKEAQDILTMLDSLFPREAAWREEVKELAARQTYLLSPHGYIRRFYDVYHNREVSRSYEPQHGDRLFSRGGKLYKRITGEEAEDAIAFGPANCAFGEIKDRMLVCEELDYNARFRLINQIHDELFFEPPVKLVDECLASVAEVMESASKVLIDPEVAPNGLKVGVEASVGYDSWAQMKTVYQTDVRSLL